MGKVYFLPVLLIGVIVIMGFEGFQNPKNGDDLYEEHCQSCHMKKGKGFFRMYPPLTDTAWVGNDERMVDVILGGLSGEITVNGKTYDGEMPPMSYLTDEEISQIINYIRREVVAFDMDTISTKAIMERRAMK